MAYALLGTARAGLPKRDPVEARSNGGNVAELLAWDSLGGNRLRGSTGGRPWFGMRNDIQPAPAICGSICTGRSHAVNRTSPVSAQPTAQTVGGHDRLGGERWRGAAVREGRGLSPGAHVGKVSQFSAGRCRCGWGVSPVPVQMWEGLCRCEVGDRFSPGADEGGVEPVPVQMGAG